MFDKLRVSKGKSTTSQRANRANVTNDMRVKDNRGRPITNYKERETDMTVQELLQKVAAGEVERDRGISTYCHANGYTSKNAREAELALYGNLS